MTTKFARPERLAMSDVGEQAQQVLAAAENLWGKEIASAVPDVFLILNEQRQVVYANDALFEQLGLPKGFCVNGQRPGELLGCIYSRCEPGGCGCSELCGACGAVRAILAAQAGERRVEECHIQRTTYDSLDLRVTASPVKLGDQRFTLFTIVDISSEKRRRVLERLFFHDVMNTAGSLLSYSHLLLDCDSDEQGLYLQRLNLLAEQLVDEIMAQRELAAAENGELTAHPQEVSLPRLLDELYSYYVGQCLGRGIELQKEAVEPLTLLVDPGLLRRTVGNMLKNAVEAVSRGGKVRLGVEQVSAGIRIWVWNQGSIRSVDQAKIFQRSFSTKGESRGLGTYSMKLLGEKYLGGWVGFSSAPETGTTFWIQLPLDGVKATG